MDPGELFRARSREEWRSWLEEHHAARSEIWLVMHRKHSATPSVPYEEAVEEALCFGWIDGQSKKLDEDSYAQRFTPRRARSNWSESNVRRANKMIAEGRMTEAGLKAFNRRPSGQGIVKDEAGVKK